MVNSPLIRPAISWGGAFGGVPLGSHDKTESGENFIRLENPPFKDVFPIDIGTFPMSC